MNKKSVGLEKKEKERRKMKEKNHYYLRIEILFFILEVTDKEKIAWEGEFTLRSDP